MTNADESYVVFGGQDFSGGGFNLSELDSRNGFVINGFDEFDRSGGSVSAAGDINGDGVDDLLVGGFDSLSYADDSSESYVIFGGQDFSSGRFDLSELNGDNGFVFEDTSIRYSEYDFVLGVSVSDAGDVNGDGIDDFVVVSFSDFAYGELPSGYLVLWRPRL